MGIESGKAQPLELKEVLKKKLDKLHPREVIRGNIYYFNASKTALIQTRFILFNRLRPLISFKRTSNQAIGIISASCTFRHRCISRSECPLVLSAFILVSSQPKRSLRQHSPFNPLSYQPSNGTS
jgi:hypothetical protein